MTPFFALTLSDAATPEMMEDRCRAISALSERFPTLKGIRVRDDAMDSELLSCATEMARHLGLEVFIESSVQESLISASFEDAILMSRDLDMDALIRTGASCGCGVVVSDDDPLNLPSLATLADALGCPRIVLDPAPRNIKSCMEVSVMLRRMMDSGSAPRLPIGICSWSGEYALSMASVSVLYGGTIAVLDDLDEDACAVLDELIRSGIRSAASERPRSLSTKTATLRPVYISSFSRIDTVTWPGKYLSVVRVNDGEGDGENMTEVANTIRGDKDSIDAVLLIMNDGDPETVPGIHRFIKAIVPPRMPLIMLTSGTDPSALDDLVGAGYVNRVAFRFTAAPSKEQEASLDRIRDSDAEFCVCCVLDPSRMSSKDVEHIADASEGSGEFILLMPRDPGRRLGKRDVNALVKTLKGRAKGVRTMPDVRTDRDPHRRRD